MPKKSTLDPRSADPVLIYTGSAEGIPSRPGVPARDLSANDLAKIVFRRSRLAQQDKGFNDALQAAYAELASTPLYIPAPAPAEV